MGIVFLPRPPQWPNQPCLCVCVCGWEASWCVGGVLSFLLSCPLFIPTLLRPCRGCTEEGRERKGTCLHVRFTRTQRGGKKKIKLLRHARMRTRAYERMLARSLAPRLIQRGITMGMCEKTEWLRRCEGTSLTLVQLRLQSPTKFYKKAKKNPVQNWIRHLFLTWMI